MNHGDQLEHVEDREIAYEVHIYNEETMQKGMFEVFVGMEVAKLENVPVELVVKILPSTTYAVFTLEGQQITSDWYQIAEQWLPQAGYQTAYEYSFQLYDQRFKGLDNLDESALDVYMPVKRR
jgi:AraC family transcriptional regulator